jgi:hypothetical protein
MGTYKHYRMRRPNNINENSKFTTLFTNANYYFHCLSQNPLLHTAGIQRHYPPAEPKNRNNTAMVPQRDYHVSHIRIKAGRSCQINLTDDPKISAN